MAVATVTLERRWPPLALRLGSAVARARVPLAAFVASQLVVLAVALTEIRVTGASLGAELGRWDGQWYLALAAHGYPAVIPHGQSTLGFLPLYPALMWLLAHLPGVSLMSAGLVIARAGGLAATLLVWRLAARWWGEEAGRRGAVLFAMFPGAVVFSLVYSDGLFVALVAGCLLALDDRRWWLAGGLGALATATGADGSVLVAACLTAVALHIWRTRAWANRSELRCLAAAGLAPVGLVAFGTYLWVRLGTPFASLSAQSRWWGHHLTPWATVRSYWLFLRLDARDLSLLIGLLGVPFVIGTRYLLLRKGSRPPGPAMVWGFGVTALTLGSAGLTPNPRMLLFAFPSGVVLARYLRGAPYWAVVLVSTGALGALSWWTLAGHVLP